MKMSQLYLATLREVPAEADVYKRQGMTFMVALLPEASSHIL